MPYVDRDVSGAVVGCYHCAQRHEQEYLHDEHPDIAQYKARFVRHSPLWDKLDMAIADTMAVPPSLRAVLVEWKKQLR